jgi:hypothetical protein
MKTKSILSLGLFFIALFPGLAQLPSGFNYQAVARDATGSPIVNRSLPVRITIQSDSLGGTVFWQEQHLSATTNGYGIINVVIGKGSKVTGSAATFSDIDWSATPKFIKTEIDNSGWKNMGTSRIWSVPYALVADKANGVNEGSKLAVVSGDDAGTDALFEVRRKDGQTVFAVYPDAVNVYVPRSGKGLKGGFAVGGFGDTKLAPQDYLRVTPDSVRVYIDETTKKGLKGGFAVGGFGDTKAPPVELFYLNRDNNFIGFESGLKTSDGLYNTFFGFQAGKSNTLGSNNVFMGYQAGLTNVASSNNVFIGYQSGLNNFSGANNIFLGYKSGYNNIGADNNVFIGNESGFNTRDGFGNIYLGYYAGHENSAGYGNSFIGYRAGYKNNANQNSFFGYSAGENNISGAYNLYMGPYAGYGNIAGSSGNYNIFLGNYSGQGVTTGSYNTLIGFQSGRAFSSGTGNVFLGYRSGYYNDTCSYNVFIGKESGFANNSGTFNTFIGYNSGRANTTGDRNIFLGYHSGMMNTSGADNMFMGSSAGYSNTTGHFNVFVGSQAGYSNQDGQYNTFLGYQAGYNNIGGAGVWEGEYNTFLGYQAGFNSTSSHRNIAIGYRAGYGYTTNRYNICIGEQSGLSLASGQANVIIGTYAGQSLNGAEGNVILGLDAGYYTTTGSHNVMIGLGSGRSANGSDNVFLGTYSGYGETGSNKLVIENNYLGSDNAINALVYGDFSTNYVALNGDVNIQDNLADYVLDVNNKGGNRYGIRTQVGPNDGSGYIYHLVCRDGDGTYMGGVRSYNGVVELYNISDARLKTNIFNTAINALGIVNNLRVVDFEMNTLPGIKHTGYIAQEAEKVFPDMVGYDSENDIYTVSMSALVPVLNKAIQEQQAEIANLRSENEHLRQRIEKLELMFKSISAGEVTR